VTNAGSQFIRSTASNVIGYAVTVGVWFVLTPFLLHRLGASAFGLWALVGSLVAYGTLLDLGVGAAVTKYVAELRARGESEEASDVVATALRIYCCVAMLLLAAVIPLSFVLPGLFDLPPAQLDDARWVVALTGVALAVQLPATTAYAVLRGLQRYDLINLIGVSATLALAAASVGVLLVGGGVVGLVAVGIPITLLWQLPMITVIRHVAPDLRFGFRGARRSLVRTVLSFSASLFVINGAAVVKGRTDELVIASALPLARVAPYSIARRVAELPGIVAYQFVRILMPFASQLHGEGDTARVQALYVGSTRVSLALFIPIGAALVVLAEPLLTAWVGASYAHDAPIVVILVAAGLLEIALWPATSILQAGNAHHLLAVFAGASALLNLGLSLLLVHPMGVRGVALGTLIATGLEAAVVVPFAARRYRVEAATMARSVLAPTLVPAVPAVLVLMGLRAGLEPASFPALILVGLVGMLVYAAGYLSFSATGDERRAVQRLAARTRHLARVRRP
jgi:O-antigen/teichoic acid export membrane protein